MSILSAFVALTGGFFLWTLFEYLLHRFAMHHLGGKGIMSREHLEHHVHSSWRFDYTHLLSWAGMLLVGFAIWNPIVRVLVSPIAGWSVAVGWALGYFFYEFQHMASHLWAPKGRYQTWVRRHHFHHHFGHPMSNHGVTVIWWDKLFGSYERPTQVRVPRRLALPWLVDEAGELHSQFVDDYVLVGHAEGDHKIFRSDRERAFASAAPQD